MEDFFKGFYWISKSLSTIAIAIFQPTLKLIFALRLFQYLVKNQNLFQVEKRYNIGAIDGELYIIENMIKLRDGSTHDIWFTSEIIYIQKSCKDKLKQKDSGHQ